jgi:hypothetical protein
VEKQLKWWWVDTAVEHTQGRLFVHLPESSLKSQWFRMQGGVGGVRDNGSRKGILCGSMWPSGPCHRAQPPPPRSIVFIKLGKETGEIKGADGAHCI